MRSCIASSNGPSNFADVYLFMPKVSFALSAIDCCKERQQSSHRLVGVQVQLEEWTLTESSFELPLKASPAF